MECGQYFCIPKMSLFGAIQSTFLPVTYTMTYFKYKDAAFVYIQVIVIIIQEEM